MQWWDRPKTNIPIPKGKNSKEERSDKQGQSKPKALRLENNLRLRALPSRPTEAGVSHFIHQLEIYGRPSLPFYKKKWVANVETLKKLIKYGLEIWVNSEGFKFLHKKFVWFS